LRAEISDWKGGNQPTQAGRDPAVKGVVRGVQLRRPRTKPSPSYAPTDTGVNGGELDKRRCMIDYPGQRGY
jgi:hypothetical protein